MTNDGNNKFKKENKPGNYIESTVEVVQIHEQR